jgi:hypothetical protein
MLPITYSTYTGMEISVAVVHFRISSRHSPEEIKKYLWISQILADAAAYVYT